MPSPGSVTTETPSAETVAVPEISARPLEGSNEMMLSFVPGVALKTLGNVIARGESNSLMPGAWMVMTNECCNSPGGRRLVVNDGGMVLIPISPPINLDPSGATRLPPETWRLRSARSGGVRFGADAALAVMMLIPVAAIGWRDERWMRD